MSRIALSWHRKKAILLRPGPDVQEKIEIELWQNLLHVIYHDLTRAILLVEKSTREYACCGLGNL